MEDRFIPEGSVDWRMRYRITVRYGGARQRYHTLEVEAEDAVAALRRTADQLPPEIAPDVDLVELRVAVDADDRKFLGEDG